MVLIVQKYKFHIEVNYKALEGDGTLIHGPRIFSDKCEKQVGKFGEKICKQCRLIYGCQPIRPRRYYLKKSTFGFIK